MNTKSSFVAVFLISPKNLRTFSAVPFSPDVAASSTNIFTNSGLNW